jgi:hypothetical protein
MREVPSSFLIGEDLAPPYGNAFLLLKPLISPSNYQIYLCQRFPLHSRVKPHALDPSVQLMTLRLHGLLRVIRLFMVALQSRTHILHHANKYFTNLYF